PSRSATFTWTNWMRPDLPRGQKVRIRVESMSFRPKPVERQVWTIIRPGRVRSIFPESAPPNARKEEPGFELIFTGAPVIAAWRAGLRYIRYRSAAVAGSVTLCWIVFGMLTASGACRLRLRHGAAYLRRDLRGDAGLALERADLREEGHHVEVLGEALNLPTRNLDDLARGQLDPLVRRGDGARRRLEHPRVRALPHDLDDRGLAARVLAN